MSGLAGSWSATLDALEADVDALDGALAAGRTVVVSAWQPPTELGPVPDELAARAHRLVARISEVQDRGRRRMARLQAELGELDRRRDAGAAYSSTGPGRR